MDKLLPKQKRGSSWNYENQTKSLTAPMSKNELILDIAKVVSGCFYFIAGIGFLSMMFSNYPFTDSWISLVMLVIFGWAFGRVIEETTKPKSK